MARCRADLVISGRARLPPSLVPAQLQGSVGTSPSHIYAKLLIERGMTMAITITVADIKRKAMIGASVITYDSAINSLISEMQSPIEYSIADCYLNDTINTKLQATLQLGILEIITGEFLEQLRREVGASEAVTIAGITLGASEMRGADLVQQGATRLAPFLKSALPMMSDTIALSTTVSSEATFSADQEVW